MEKQQVKLLRKMVKATFLFKTLKFEYNKESSHLFGIMKKYKNRSV